MVLCQFHTEMWDERMQNEQPEKDFSFIVVAETREECERLAMHAMHKELGTNDKWHGPDMICTSDENGLFKKYLIRSTRPEAQPTKRGSGRPRKGV